MDAAPTFGTLWTDIITEGHLEEFCYSGCEPEMTSGRPRELVFYTGLAIDPTDPEQDRLVWFDLASAAHANLSGGATSLDRLIDHVGERASIRVIERSSWGEEELPEIVIFTGFAIDPTDAMEDRLIPYRRSEDPEAPNRHVDCGESMYRPLVRTRR